jgi:hypothetical protein
MNQQTFNIVEHKSRWSKFDLTLVWCVAVIGIVTLMVVLVAPLFFIPAEDAVILFQFSRNLASTGSITFITNGPRAEGATDFAWMTLIAAAMKMHVPPFWTVAVINAASLATLPFLLTRIAGCQLRLLPALFMIGAFGLFPQFSAAISGFSVLPFACLLILLAWCFLKRNDVALALVSLLLCLFRPDGVVFAVPVMIAALYLFPGRWRRIFIFAVCFVLPGLAYFFWRWHYFGVLLPLPALVKSNVHRVWHLFVPYSVAKGLLLFLFAFAMSLLVLPSWRTLKGEIRSVLICFLLLPSLFYFEMRLDQDIGRRFFIYLPVGVAVLIASRWNEIGPRSARILRFGFALWCVLIFPLSRMEAVSFWPNQRILRKAIAEDLNSLPHGTLIVTEAGILPYYSGWAAYDAWGLNTPGFTRHLVQPSDVSEIRPDLMLIHAEDNECTPSADWQRSYPDRTWPHMTRNLISVAGSHYDLWYTPLANPDYQSHLGLKQWEGDQDCWLVRRDSPLRDSVEGVLERHGALTAPQYQADVKVGLKTHLQSKGLLDRLLDYIV